MALVVDHDAAPAHELLNAEIAGAKIIGAKIVNGEIVGGRIVGGRIVEKHHLGQRARHALNLEGKGRPTEVIAVLGLGLALLLIYVL